MDRYTAEVLAARALRIAIAVLGDENQALDAVTHAAERVRLEGAQGDAYGFQLLKALVVSLRAAADTPDRNSTGVSRGERTETAVPALQRLPLEERILIALCSIDGVTYSDAARLTGISRQDCLTRLAAARRRLWEAEA